MVRPRKKEEILVVVGYTFGNCAGRLGRLLEGSRAMGSFCLWDVIRKTGTKARVQSSSILVDGGDVLRRPGERWSTVFW